MGTIINHCKDPYETTSIMETKRVFRGSYVYYIWIYRYTYSWWKKSPTTTWHVWNLVNHGKNYQPQLVQDFFHQQYDMRLYTHITYILYVYIYLYIHTYVYILCFAGRRNTAGNSPLIFWLENLHRILHDLVFFGTLNVYIHIFAYSNDGPPSLWNEM